MWYTIQTVTPKNPSFNTVIEHLKNLGQPATVLIDREVYLDAEVDVPEQIELVFSRGGRLLSDSGQVLRLAKPPRATLCQIFGKSISPQTTSPSVTFTSPAVRVYPEWWGAIGQDGASNYLTTWNTFALRSALASVRPNGGEVSIVQGDFYIDPRIGAQGDEDGQFLRIASRISIRGGGASLVKLTFLKGGFLIEPRAQDVLIEGLSLVRSAPDDDSATGIWMTTGGPIHLREVGFVNFGIGVRQEAAGAGQCRGLSLERCGFLQCSDGVVVDSAVDVLLDQCRVGASKPTEGEPYIPVRGHSFGKDGSEPCRNVVVRDCIIEMWKEWAVRVVNVDGLEVEGCYAETYYSIIPLKRDRPFVVIEKRGVCGEGARIGLNYLHEVLHGQSKNPVQPSDRVVWKDVADSRDSMRTRIYTIDGRDWKEPRKDNQGSSMGAESFVIRPPAAVWNQAPAPGTPVGWVCRGMTPAVSQDGPIPTWKWSPFGQFDPAGTSSKGWIPFGPIFEEESK